MKKLLCAALAALLAILPAACPAESADGFQPRLDPDTACTITVIGSYSNFEALEAEFDRFNEYYPDVELSYVKPDDYNNLLGTVLESSDAPNIFFSYQWMVGSEKYQTAWEHMEDLADPALGLDLGCLRPGLMSPDAEGHLLMVPQSCSLWAMASISLKANCPRAIMNSRLPSAAAGMRITVQAVPVMAAISA